MLRPVTGGELVSVGEPDLGRLSVIELRIAMDEPNLLGPEAHLRTDAEALMVGPLLRLVRHALDDGEVEFESIGPLIVFAGCAEQRRVELNLHGQRQNGRNGIYVQLELVALLIGHRLPLEAIARLVGCVQEEGEGLVVDLAFGIDGGVPEIGVGIADPLGPVKPGRRVSLGQDRQHRPTFLR